MAHIVWTPWREHKEVLTVRGQLYPSEGEKNLDLRRKACSQISAWKVRGNLPHAVESTWLLTDAILADDIRTNRLSPLAVRACYITAFCRFVTGLVDSEQDAKYKVSMYVKAKQIGLPASFVELRHEAIHGDLPSLMVLRKAATRALDWLWNDYWKFLDVRTGNLDEDEISAFKDGREKLKEDFREILQEYLTGSIQVKNSQQAPGPVKPTSHISLGLVRICQGEKLAILELIKVLLEYKMLIPRSKILGRHMEEVFSWWDVLLKQLTLHQKLFLTLLIDEMLIHLIAPSTMDVKIDTYREAVTMWLVHISTTKGWAASAKRGKLNEDSILSTCLQNPNHWTIHLASAVIHDPSRMKYKEIYGERVAKAAAEMRAWLETDEGLSEQATRLGKPITSEDDPEVGWEKWKGAWISKPIGMI